MHACRHAAVCRTRPDWGVLSEALHCIAGPWHVQVHWLEGCCSASHGGHCWVAGLCFSSDRFCACSIAGVVLGGFSRCRHGSEEVCAVVTGASATRPLSGCCTSHVFWKTFLSCTPVVVCSMKGGELPWLGCVAGFSIHVLYWCEVVVSGAGGCGVPQFCFQQFQQSAYKNCCM